MTSQRLTVSIPLPMYRRLQKFSRESGMTKTHVVCSALTVYFAQFNEFRSYGCDYGKRD